MICFHDSVGFSILSAAVIIYRHFHCSVFETVTDRSSFLYSDEKMDSCEYDDDGVRDEKVNVFYRYRLFLNTVNLFQLIEFVIAVALILWSSYRVISVLKISGDNLWWMFSPNLLNQRSVFLVGNVIIVLCYVISRYSEDGNRSEKYGVKYSHRKTSDNCLFGEEGNKSEKYDVKYDASIGESVTPLPEKAEVTEETSGEKLENPNEERDYAAAVITASETEMEVAIKQAAKQIERFRRTQSEKLKREISIKPNRELQRSATAGRSPETVEKLSNEEFQIAVETFIWKQQSFLKQEGMAENGTKL